MDAQEAVKIALLVTCVVFLLIALCGKNTTFAVVGVGAGVLLVAEILESESRQ